MIENDSHASTVVTVTARDENGDLREVEAKVPDHHERCSCGAWKYEDGCRGDAIQPHCGTCHRIVRLRRKQGFTAWEDYDPDVWSWSDYFTRAYPLIGYSGHRACATCGKCAKDLPKPWGFSDQREHPLYCSTACRQKAYRDRVRDGHNPVVVTVTVLRCANCQEALGDEVWINHLGAWRCGTCAGEGHYPNVTVCEPCGRTIHTVNSYRRFCSATCRQRDSRARKAARKAARDRYTLAEG